MENSKRYQVRLSEILDASEKLFCQKGYEKTTINDILKEVNIGKGTFYHYFKSKEEVMDFVIKRVVYRYAESAKLIEQDSNLSVHEKFIQIILGQAQTSPNKDWMIEEFHKVENARMHQKNIIETIKALTPILTNVINQGIEEGVFKTPYPSETVEILLSSVQVLYDKNNFDPKGKDAFKKVEAFVYSMEILQKNVLEEENIAKKKMD